MATVSEMVTNNQDYISSMQAQAIAAADTLNAYADSWTADVVSAVGAPTLNNYDSLETALSLIPPFMPPIFSISPPPVGIIYDAPLLSGYTAPVWSELFWDNLKSKLTVITDNITGADDIDTLVNKLTSETDKLGVAMYAADRERKLQGLRDLYNAAGASVAAKGFSYPNSMMTALMLDAQQKYQFDLSQTSRDLIKYIFEWAKDSLQFVIQQQVSAHVADVDFNIRYAGALLQSYSTTINAALEKYRSDLAYEVSKAETYIKGYITQIDQLKSKAAIFETEDKIKLQGYAEDIKNSIGATQLTISALKDTSANKIAAATAIMNGISSIAQSASQITIASLKEP